MYIPTCIQNKHKQYDKKVVLGIRQHTHGRKQDDHPSVTNLIGIKVPIKMLEMLELSQFHPQCYLCAIIIYNWSYSKPRQNPIY